MRNGEVFQEMKELIDDIDQKMEIADVNNIEYMKESVLCDLYNINFQLINIFNRINDGISR